MKAPDFTTVPVAELLRLEGRCAVVTGGARGLGAAIAGRLAAAGARVAIGDLDGSAAEACAAEIAAKFGAAAFGGHLDVRDGSSMHAFAAQSEAALGPVRIWVNNAGIYPMRALVEMEEEEWDQVSDINLRGCFLGCREAARRMIARKDTAGAILNIASVSGLRGRAGLAHYTATKHGVIGLTKSLALELGRHGIRVLALAPTLAATPGITERQQSGGGQVADLERSLSSDLPLGRIAVPDDIARVALFAVSDMAALVTGTTLSVDAGALAL